MAYYGGSDNPYEFIKVSERWQPGFRLGNALKYVVRAGKKPRNTVEDDLTKAVWYLRRILEVPVRDYMPIDPESCDKTVKAWQLPRPLASAVRSMCLYTLLENKKVMLHAIAKLEEYMDHSPT